MVQHSAKIVHSFCILHSALFFAVEELSSNLCKSSAVLNHGVRDIKEMLQFFCFCFCPYTFIHARDPVKRQSHVRYDFSENCLVNHPKVELGAR